jgi:hypothetical protein
MTVTINDIDFTGNPCRRVTATWNGRTFTAGERTWAHLFETQDWIDRTHPGWYIYVVQGAYNTGVDLSAGTHDYDGTVDTLLIHRVTGKRNWVSGQRWFRQCGWACWWRKTGSWLSPSNWHFHQNSLGCEAAGCPVGYLIPGQNSDYYNKKSGLSGHYPDPTWHPADIPATVFNYKAWMRRKEEEAMDYKDWSKEGKDAFWADFAEHGAPAVWNEDVNSREPGAPAFAGKSFRTVVKDIWHGVKGGE